MGFVRTIIRDINAVQKHDPATRSKLEAILAHTPLHAIIAHRFIHPLYNTGMRIVPRLSRAIVAATGAAGWNVLQNNHRIAGQAVDHVHVHIIPRQEGDGLGYRWPAGKLDEAEARQLREQITGGL